MIPLGLIHFKVAVFCYFYRDRRSIALRRFTWRPFPRARLSSSQNSMSRLRAPLDRNPGKGRSWRASKGEQLKWLKCQEMGPPGTHKGSAVFRPDKGWPGRRPGGTGSASFPWGTGREESDETARTWSWMWHNNKTEQELPGSDSCEALD